VRKEDTSAAEEGSNTAGCWFCCCDESEKSVVGSEGCDEDLEDLRPVRVSHSDIVNEC
jgi:hypothetical protein